MKTIAKALLQHVILLAALLAISGYAVSDLPIHWSIVRLTFLISIGAMITNDCVNRINDNLKKEKSEAYDNAKITGVYLCFLWFVVLLLVVLILNSWSLLLLLMLAMIALSIGYSYSQKYVFLQTSLVAIACSIPPLFAFAEGGSVKCLVVSFSTFFIVCAREMLKYMQEANEDKGYEKTTFTENKIADPRKAMHIIATLMLVGSLASVFLFYPIQYNWAYLPYCAGLIVCIIASLLTGTEMHSISDIEGGLNVGAALILIAIVTQMFF